MRFHLLPFALAALSLRVSASSAAAEGGSINSRCVTLQAVDEIEFIVPISSAQQSELVKMMIDEDDVADEECQKVPLPNVKSGTLGRIIPYLNYHAENPAAPIPKPLPSNKLADAGVSEWDSEFISFGVEDTNDIEALSGIFPVLKEVIEAANYMHIQSLLDLSTAKLATLIYGKTPKDVQTIMGVTDKQLAEHKEWKAQEALETRKKAREAIRIAREAAARAVSTTSISPEESSAPGTSI
jgi:S-phase kinase-associated protein 1